MDKIVTVIWEMIENAVDPDFVSGHFDSSKFPLEISNNQNCHKLCFLSGNNAWTL